jgi:hypothetical protein
MKETLKEIKKITTNPQSISPVSRPRCESVTSRREVHCVTAAKSVLEETVLEETVKRTFVIFTFYVNLIHEMLLKISSIHIRQIRRAQNVQINLAEQFSLQ